jgi:GTP-binding protein LepA
LMNGTVRKGQKIRFLRAGTTHEVLELGQFVPQRRACEQLVAGQVGYLICNIKVLGQVHVGDTVSVPSEEAAEPLPGYRVPQRMVYCGLYPSDGQDFEELRDALTKLAINDPSFEFVPETSDALGFGFRCGFLGLLHMEIIQQRLEREHDLDMIQTAPTVTYKIKKHDGTEAEIHSPGVLPSPDFYDELLEPVARVSLLLPAEYIGVMMQIANDHRGTYVRQEYLSTTRVQLVYDVPLAELIYDFYDKLKSATRGYGTLNYEILGFRADDLVKLRIMVNGEEVDALSTILHRDQAEYRGRAVIKKLRKEIPRHLFEIALQAAIGQRVIARENIAALRKDVTAKCYGGDITRKRKLLEKQKEGKRRMKQIGNVDIPQKAFLSVLGSSEEGK